MALPPVPSFEKKAAVQAATIRHHRSPARSRSGEIPNASLIYGIASGALFAIAIYYLLSGLWVTGALLFVPAFAILGFSLHFLRGSV